MYIFLYILIIVIVLVVSTKRPSIALAFMLCTFGLEQWLQSKNVFFLNNSSVVNIVTGLTVVYALAVKFIKEKKFIGHYSTESWLILFLYLYALVSILWSPVPEISQQNYIKSFPYIMMMVVMAPLLITKSEDVYKSQLFLIILGGAIMVMLMFFTEWGYRSIVLAGHIGKSVDIRANPLAIANLAGYIMLAAVLLNIRNQSKLWNTGRWVLVVICLAVSVKTGSRGQFLIMIFMALAFLPVSRKITNLKQFFPLVIGIVFIAAVGYWALSEFSGADTRWDSGKMSDDMGGRFAAVGMLLDAWLRSPINILFGLGSSASFDKSIAGYYPHIVSLEILGELGLLGFSLLLIVLYKLYKDCRRSMKLISNDMFKKGVFASIVAITMFEFILSFKQSSFLNSPLLFGLLIVVMRLNYSIINDQSNEIEKEVEITKESDGMDKKFTGVQLRK